MNHGIGPAGYHEQHYSSRDWHFYRGILSTIIQRSEPGPVLDLGAGVGYLVEACHRWGLKCVGLEGSKRAVEISKERDPELDVRESLLSAPLPFKDNTFSAIIMNQVIEHLEPIVASNCLSESFRVLRPGGVIIIYSPSKSNAKERLADPTHLYMYSPGELRSLLESKGFSDVCSLDSPLPLLGKNRIGQLIMKYVFRLVPIDSLSATANCCAYKPS